MLDPLITNYRKRILDIAKKHGVRDVRVFGSMSRGSSKSSSDADFLVDLEDGYDLFNLGACQMDLQDLLRRKVDMVTRDALNPKIRERVLQDAVPL